MEVSRENTETMVRNMRADGLSSRADYLELMQARIDDLEVAQQGAEACQVEAGLVTEILEEFCGLCRRLNPQHEECLHCRDVDGWRRRAGLPIPGQAAQPQASDETAELFVPTVEIDAPCTCEVIEEIVKHDPRCPVHGTQPHIEAR